MSGGKGFCTFGRPALGRPGLHLPLSPVLAALPAHADVLVVDSAQAGQVSLLKASENLGSGPPAVHIAARALTLAADDSLGQRPVRNRHVDNLQAYGGLVGRGLGFAGPTPAWLDCLR
jgi:hypothetical protein